MTAIEDWHSAMGRIVSETNISGPGVDLWRFYDGLRDAVISFRVFEEHFAKTGEARRTKMAKKALAASKHIAKLAKLLGDPDLSAEIAHVSNLDGIEKGNALAAEAVAAILAKPSLSKIDSDLGSLAYLIGRQLPLVYEATFAREAGRSRPSDGGQLGGPYIRFVTAVLREFNIGSYSPEYIGQMYAAGAKEPA